MLRCVKENADVSEKGLMIKDLTSSRKKKIGIVPEFLVLSKIKTQLF